VAFFSDEMIRTFEGIVGRYPVKRSALIPILHEVQARDGFLTPEAMVEVARYLGLHAMEVAETASFYDLLYLRPVGKHVIHFCHNLSCTLRGAERVLAHLERTLAIREGETTPDGLFTLKRMECLAACGGAPAMQVDGEYYERVTEAQADEIVARLRRQGQG
jgi:NADH-quinone oxidoreductase subunit E